MQVKIHGQNRDGKHSPGYHEFPPIPCGDEGFIYSSSILTIGLVMFVSIMAITVLIWSFGFGPAYVN